MGSSPIRSICSLPAQLVGEVLDNAYSIINETIIGSVGKIVSFLYHLVDNLA